jgi:hypothetical protein
MWREMTARLSDFAPDLAGGGGYGCFFVHVSRMKVTAVCAA